uniref:UL11 n=1 Tax=Macrostomum lignano TaxID=282301 RepID=A0A1I8FNN8_9PLAT
SPRLPRLRERRRRSQPFNTKPLSTTTTSKNDEFDAGYQRRHGLVRNLGGAEPRHGGKPCQSAGRPPHGARPPAYMRGLNPSHYGVAMDNFEDAFDADPVPRRPGTAGPDLPPGLVKDSPTSRTYLAGQRKFYLFNNNFSG